MNIPWHRIVRLAAMAVLALAAALYALPARWLLGLQPAQGLIAVVDATGTVWRGQAWLALGPPDYRRAIAEPLRWQLAWSGALPQVEVRHPWLAGPLKLRLGLNGMAVSAQSLEMPASALGLLHPGVRQAGPEGILRAQWPAMPLGRPSPSEVREFSLDWLDAASSLSSVRPMGAYHIAVRQSRDGVDLSLEPRQGPLLLQGAGTLRQGRFSFEGSASIAGQADRRTRAVLTSMLQALGPLQNGHVPLRFH